MATFVTIVHVIACILLVLVVLVQSGKGAEISASLGGSSQTVFGSSGGANFFTRFTAACATIFMCTSLYLTWHGTKSRKGLFEDTQTSSSAPVQPAAPAGAGTTTGTSAETPNAATAPAAGTEAAKPTDKK